MLRSSAFALSWNQAQGGDAMCPRLHAAGETGRDSCQKTCGPEAHVFQERVERREMSSLPRGERLQLCIKQMERAGWRRTHRARSA